MRRRVLAGFAGLAAGTAAAGGLLAAGGQDGGRATARAAADPATAPVERRDLVDRETVAGTLDYADSAALAAGVTGTLTGLRAEGTAVGRGGWLYEVDGERTGWLLYGRRPAWRDLGPQAGEGADVRQLERNLAALGHEPGAVDGEWTAATTAAVRDFQADRGLAEDGSLSLGEIVFRPGRVRVGELRAQVGRRVGPGMEIGTVSSTRREVNVDLPADRQQVARRGAGVVVDLPDGRRARGRIAEVGSVARSAGQDGTPTVEVRIRLRGAAARRSGFDAAPVDVGFESERAAGALVVPVLALLARPGGGYAVEVPGRGLVGVEPGLYADGLVALTGDLRPGERVVVPS